ncbi:PEP-CTERM sorting domain-containing protein [Microcoleus sp. D2_18a_B4]|uniref:PEP-CTERM sorting domain-containing protein n=1 Tax=Microcoleus sp. D2_18a_B4 TaxID=3055329 RepID=UPI002FCFA50C
MATAFYYLAAAPPASAQDVCGPGNYSPVCFPSPPSPPPKPEPPLPEPPATQPSLSQIYKGTPSRNSTAIPEPGTAIAVLLTGAAMIGSCRKRNKQVGPQR